jgi:hypothetical protein
MTSVLVYFEEFGFGAANSAHGWREALQLQLTQQRHHYFTFPQSGSQYSTIIRYDV